MQVTLMNQNVELITMDGAYEQNVIPLFICTNIVEVHTQVMLPFFFINQEISPERINYYLAKRSYNLNRAIIKDKIEIKWIGNDQFPYPPLLSLSDQYWLRTDKSQKWEDINLFDNKFDHTFGDYILCKQKEKFTNPTFSFLNPDITSNGILDKRWVWVDPENQFLIKSRNELYGQEPLNEILATKILSQVNPKINFIPYEYTVEQYELCSKCKNFISKDEEFVPAYHIYKSLPKVTEDTYYQHLLKCIEKHNIPNGEKALKEMFFADELTHNKDRHLGNFGYIRSAKTGKILRPAPLFDFGNTFRINGARIKTETQIFEKEQKEYLKTVDMPKINFKDLTKDIFAYPYINNNTKYLLKEKFDLHNPQKINKEIEAILR